MALTADYDAKEKPGTLVAYSVAAGAVIYKGALVCVNAGGYAVPAADTAGFTFLGVAYEAGDNTDGANGALTVRVQKTGTFVYTRTGAAQADIGDPVYALGDDTVADAAGATNDVPVGYVVGIEGTNKVRVRIDGAVR